jgi:hypothetical protein
LVPKIELSAMDEEDVPPGSEVEPEPAELEGMLAAVPSDVAEAADAEEMTTSPESEVEKTAVELAE